MKEQLSFANCEGPTLACILQSSHERPWPSCLLFLHFLQLQRPENYLMAPPSCSLMDLLLDEVLCWETLPYENTGKPPIIVCVCVCVCAQWKNKPQIAFWVSEVCILPGKSFLLWGCYCHGQLRTRKLLAETFACALECNWKQLFCFYWNV